AYLFLSVGYIQMLKAFNPVAILLISFAIKIKEPSRRLFVIVLTISFGVCMASYGELHFNLVGWTPIMTAIPHLGFGHLFANAMTAFMLNVAAVWLVGVGGGLVLTLAGVFKLRNYGPTNHWYVITMSPQAILILL
ncbi:15685_t:CDS:2, partial [Acaulospora colombiana]